MDLVYDFHRRHPKKSIPYGLTLPLDPESLETYLDASTPDTSEPVRLPVHLDALTSAADATR